jgi:dTDP-4-dehydrorhamnose reductase
MPEEQKKRIVILGASGFIGNAIYKELCSYFKTFGSYHTTSKLYKDNQQFFHYDHEQDDIYEILEALEPNVIISSLRGNFNSQIIAHQHILEYIKTHKCRLIFLSSANVFDAYSKYPSYEKDKTLSESIYGRLKIKIENAIMRLPKNKWTILRLPMVLGTNSPRIEEIKQYIKEKTPIEVFPNLVMNVTTDNKLTQQIHYIINRKKTGIYHLGSTDLVHHDDFIKDLISSMGDYNPVYKQVFTTNDERYLAVLPKHNKLPKNLQIESQDVVKISIL